MRGRLVSQVWQSDPTRYAPPRHRRACRYDAFVPRPLMGDAFNLSGEIAGIVAEAERAISDLNIRVAPELTALARLLLRTESIASSKVEGLQADVRGLARAEARRRGGRGVGREAAEILANIDAMTHAVDDAARLDLIQPADLQEIHRVLLAKSPAAGQAGAIREVQNWIGGNDYTPCGADYIPPQADEVVPLMQDLCQFCQDSVMSPLTLAAIAHAQFETIHPFEDGNGRTGRALVQVLLRRRGLAPQFVPPISVVLSQDRERYIGGLTLFRNDDVAEWVSIFAEAAAASAHLAARYVALVADLRDHWRQRLSQTVRPRADAVAWDVIDALPAYPVITVAAAVEATGRSKPAVNQAVAQLEQAGVLVRIGESKRNRAWEPEGLIDLVAALEAGEV